MGHLFDPKHNFGPLVDKYGSEEKVVEEMVKGLRGKLPPSGLFEVKIELGGQEVIVRGNVINGVPRIGTAFTPPP